MSQPDYLRRRKASVPDGFVPRDFCFRCWKAAPLCICGQLQLVENRTRVTVIQHHRERFHPAGTARIARLGLRQVQVLTGERQHSLRVRAPAGPEVSLLFPHSSARTFEATDRDKLPRHLIVLDGTWNQAKALYRANESLAQLPHFVLHPAAPSNYRIRRQPRAGYLSTIEALVQALGVLEPETAGLDGLLEAFDRLIDHQIQRREQAQKVA